MTDNTPAASSGRDAFAEYYARESLTDSTLARFAGTKDAVFALLRHRRMPVDRLTVADIGCGAGTQAMLWARDGHKVFGADINDQLVALGKQRARESNVALDLQVSSAVSLPWQSESMDICLLPELLEHVAQWRECLQEATRVLKPGGLLYISTTNRLCPMQQEFDLPLYSWYPPPLKRRYERLSVTTRPELVNHAKFPAVNWFDFYSLRRTPELANFECLDRFDVAVLRKQGLAATILKLVTKVPPLRWLAQIATPYTTVFAIRRGTSATA